MIPCGLQHLMRPPDFAATPQLLPHEAQGRFCSAQGTAYERYRDSSTCLLKRALHCPNHSINDRPIEACKGSPESSKRLDLGQRAEAYNPKPALERQLCKFCSSERIAHSSSENAIQHPVLCRRRECVAGSSRCTHLRAMLPPTHHPAPAL